MEGQVIVRGLGCRRAKHPKYSVICKHEVSGFCIPDFNAYNTRSSNLRVRESSMARHQTSSLKGSENRIGTSAAHIYGGHRTALSGFLLCTGLWEFIGR